MIDAKRLAELMEPEKLRGLADYFAESSRISDGAYTYRRERFADAAAVLRKVAEEVRYGDELPTPDEANRALRDTFGKAWGAAHGHSAGNGHAPKVAEQRGISDLVEIGRRHFVKGCTGADPALMAIHDAAPDEKTANKAYTELMSVLAAEVRFDAEDKETRRRAEIDAGKE